MQATKTAFAATIIGALWSATTLAVVTVTLTRLSDSPGCSSEPAMSGNGKRVAFSSAGDLVPTGNSDGNFEIFISDRKAGLAQITNTTGGTKGSGAPTIDSSGARVAFVSDRDLVSGMNADANNEIFLFDRKRGFSQITNTTGGSNSAPSISASGSRIAFTSDRDLVSGGNADANTEIFLFDRKKGFTQITDTSGTPTPPSNSSPALSGDSSRIAFISTADLVSGNNADKSAELFVFRSKHGFTQVTNATSCTVAHPAISKSGSRIAFSSNCDLVGTNTDKNEEIFLFDKKAGISQITDTTSCFSNKPALNGSGKRIAFVSNCDLVAGLNSDANVEIFAFDQKRGFIELTQSTGGMTDVGAGPSMSASGKRVAFELNGELSTGSNSDGAGEVYVAEIR